MIYRYQPGDTFVDASRVYRVRMSHAQGVIERPDQTEEFKFGNAPTAYLSIKHVPAARPPRHLLVTWSESELLGRRFVHAAWPIPTTLLPEVDPTPIRALEVLCEAAGVRLKVGEEERVLFRSVSGETTPEAVDQIVQMIGDPDDAPRTGLPASVPSVLGQIAMDINEEKTRYDIGLVYAIQVGRLYELIQEAASRG